MRLTRAIVLAIVVATALAGGGGPTASARATTTGPALVADADPFGAATNDPGDPGLPPD
ncbi:MAG TPA: hypothetical protein VF001_05385 [Candidatus Limnocylindria bacterium]